MGIALLQQVGFVWDKHPHRLHTMDIGEQVTEGIDLRGGPWTTGERAKDTIESRTSWTDAADLSGDLHALERRTADGPGTAEARWLLDGVDPVTPVAVVGMRVESVSHPAGFNVAGIGVGVRPGSDGLEAWCRVEAGKVPERPERFEHIEIAADLVVAVLHSETGPTIGIERLATSTTTGSGFRPHHAPSPLNGDGREVVGLAGWSWTVTNTPQRRGRYLRGFEFASTPTGATAWVSNRGEVTRRTDLDLKVDVVVRSA